MYILYMQTRLLFLSTELKDFTQEATHTDHFKRMGYLYPPGVAWNL